MEPKLTPSQRRKKEMDIAQIKSTICAHCRRREVVINEKEGTAVCKNCGLVKEFSMIDTTAEWGAGAEPSTMDRTGSNINPNLESFGIEGNITGPAGVENSIHKATKRFISRTDSNIKASMVMIKGFIRALNLTRSCSEMALDLYAAGEKKSVFPSKPIEARLAACVYMASKIVGRSKDLKELLSVVRLKRRDVTKGYKAITKNMPTSTVSIDYAEKVSNIGRTLEISDIIEKACRQGVEIVMERELLTGKNPNTIAGVAIYLVTKDSPFSLPIDKIANASGIKGQTIQRNLNYILHLQKELIPAWFRPYLK